MHTSIESGTAASGAGLASAVSWMLLKARYSTEKVTSLVISRRFPSRGLDGCETLRRDDALLALRSWGARPVRRGNRCCSTCRTSLDRSSRLPWDHGSGLCRSATSRPCCYCFRIRHRRSSSGSPSTSRRGRCRGAGPTGRGMLCDINGDGGFAEVPMSGRSRIQAAGSRE